MNKNFLPEKKVDKSLLGRDFFIPADLQGIFSFYLRGDFKSKLGGKFMANRYFFLNINPKSAGDNFLKEFEEVIK